MTVVDPPTEVPARLIDEITAGNCVAFVGAGFSAPVVPQWKQLILALSVSDRLKDEAGPRGPVARRGRDGPRPGGGCPDGTGRAWR